MTADEPVAGVPRLCARHEGCTQPRGHGEGAIDEILRLRAAISKALDAWPEHTRTDEHEAAVGEVLTAVLPEVTKMLRGPDRADAELADLRAEVERLTQDIDECWVPLYHGEVHERRQAEARAEKAEAERDDALARLAEAEGVARTNAAWVQHWHAAAKEAREQHDALQRQVDEVRRVLGEWHAETEESTGVTAEHWRGHDYAEGWNFAVEDLVRELRAALDAVEPADQPHPTPEVYTASPGWTKATGLTGGDARVEVVLGPRPRSEGEAGEPTDQPHPTPEADECLHTPEHSRTLCGYCGEQESWCLDCGAALHKCEAGS